MEKYEPGEGDYLDTSACCVVFSIHNPLRTQNSPPSYAIYFFKPHL